MLLRPGRKLSQSERGGAAASANKGGGRTAGPRPHARAGPHRAGRQLSGGAARLARRKVSGRGCRRPQLGRRAPLSFCPPPLARRRLRGGGLREASGRATRAARSRTKRAPRRAARTPASARPWPEAQLRERRRRGRRRPAAPSPPTAAPPRRHPAAPARPGPARSSPRHRRPPWPGPVAWPRPSRAPCPARASRPSPGRGRPCASEPARAPAR